MTSALEHRVQPRGTMPGWGIFADLMPPELLVSRQLRTLRKRLGAGLVVVFLLCAAGYADAMHQRNMASHGLSQAQARTAAITADQQQFLRVTQIQNDTAEIETQIASMMSDDVDFAGFLAKVRAALPATLAITSITVTITPDSGNTTTSLAGAGINQIGTVTLSGNGHTLSDLSAYVIKLTALPGVINVIPNSNTSASTGGITAFNVSFGVTDALYSHAYAKIGSN